MFQASLWSTCAFSHCLLALLGLRRWEITRLMTTAMNRRESITITTLYGQTDLSLSILYLCSCYLNPATSFVWSFISPVILILLANTGFFIMAIVIMQRHQRRQHVKNTKHKVRWVHPAIHRPCTSSKGINLVIEQALVEGDKLKLAVHTTKTSRENIAIA